MYKDGGIGRALKRLSLADLGHAKYSQTNVIFGSREKISGNESADKAKVDVF
jgi:hypothetical protein